jgi:hypothetical protein
MPSGKTLGPAGGKAGRAGEVDVDVDVGWASSRDKGAACAWSRSRSRSSHHRRHSLTPYQTTDSSAYFVCTFTSTSSSGPSFTLTAAIHPPPLIQGVAILHHVCFHPASPYACFPLPLTRFTLPHSASLCPTLLYCITVRVCGFAFAYTVVDIFFMRLQQPCRYTTSQPRPLSHTEIRAALPHLSLR